ncbi:MAG: hypothetical protein ACRD0Y_04095 [Terriglobales bacterium]
MKCSQFLAAAAMLACGSMMTWAATPAPLPGSPMPSAAVAAAPQARRRMSPAERAKMMVARIDRAVHLSPDQKTKMTAVYEKANTQSMQAMRSGDRSQMRSIFAKATKDAQALCTPAQLAHWPKPRSRRGGGLTI